MVITCATATKAQMILYANSSTITFVGGIKVSTDAVPFGQYLRARQMLGTEIVHAARMRAQYHGGDFIAAANEYAFEISKLAALKQIFAAAKATASSRSDSNYEARKHADTKRAAQRYAAKRGARAKANTTQVVTDDVYTITNGAEYDFSN